jgi:hypothetical protein
MVGNNEDRGRSITLDAEDRGWLSTGQVLGGRMIERSGDTVSGLRHAQGDDEHGFLGLASKPRSTVSPSLVSKPVATVLVIWPQTTLSGFLVWTSKPAAMVW